MIVLELGINSGGITYLENIPVGLFIYKANDHGRKWEFVNPTMEEITGYGVDEMLGKSSEEQPFYTDEALIDITERRKRYANGEQNIAHELSWITKSGGRIKVRVSPGYIRGMNGDIKGIFFIVEDITELEAARDLEELYLKVYRSRPL